MKKKIFIIVAVVLAAAVIGLLIWGGKDKKKDVTPEGINFIETIKSDIDWACDNYSDVIFYEAEARYNDTLIKDTSDLYITSLRVVLQAMDTAIIITHRYEAENDTAIIDDIWMGDMAIDLDSIKLSLPEAIVALQESEEYNMPESNCVVLRTPVGPEFFKHPFYIFGVVRTGFIKVDSGSGDISVIY